MKIRLLSFISIFYFFPLFQAFSATNIIRENQTILAVSSFEAAYQHRTQAELDSRAESRAQQLCAGSRLDSYALKEIRPEQDIQLIQADYITDDGQIRNQDFPFYRPYIYVKGDPEKRERILEEARSKLKLGALAGVSIASHLIIHFIVLNPKNSYLATPMPNFMFFATNLFKCLNYANSYFGCHVFTIGAQGLWMMANHYSEEEVTEPGFYQSPNTNPDPVYFINEDNQAEFVSHWAFEEVNCD